MYFLSLRRSINAFIRTRPGLFFPVMRMRSKFRCLIVNKDTEIVIEGYPRSANTFAVAAFNYSQGRKVCIARHTHAPAQVMQGARCSIPVVLLLRKPEDAVVSLVIRDQSMTLTKALKMYIWYHEAILEFVDKCVIADFDVVVNNYSLIIDEVNKKYNTSYKLFDHDKSSQENIFKLVEDMEKADSGGVLRESHVARPSDSRKEIKDALLSELAAPNNERLLKKCESLYNKIHT